MVPLDIAHTPDHFVISLRVLEPIRFTCRFLLTKFLKRVFLSSLID